MSKEINDNDIKTKFIDLFVIFIIIVIGVGIVCLSFFVAYNKKQKSVSIEEKNIKTSVNIEKKENVLKDNEKKDENILEKNKNNNKEVNNTKQDKNSNKEENDTEKNKIEEIKEIVKIKKNEKLPEWTDTAIQDIKDIYGSDKKQVYFTFDDGPSKEITPKILQILEEEDVPATFFVLGKCVDSHPDIVKQAYEAGHFIANHGYTHTYSKIYESIDNVINEYNQTNESIRNAIGNNDYDCHLFRFPGGSSGGPYNSLKAEAKQYLAENNVASTNWNCLTSDAVGNTTVESQYNGVLETQGNHTSLIILMHDAGDKNATPETLRKLIKHYKEEGYEFKNFYEIFVNNKDENDNIIENDDVIEHEKIMNNM